MRHYNILPVNIVRCASLSKDAVKRLWWMDWYHTHGKNAEATCRHFAISNAYLGGPVIIVLFSPKTKARVNFY